jgi:RIO kinase 2
LDNDVRASGFSKELERQFEEVSDTIGLRQDVENEDHSIEEEDEDEDDDEQEDKEEEEEPTSSLPENDEITKLTQIIDSNHLLPSPNTDEFDENKNYLFKPFQDDNKEEQENADDDNQSTVSTSHKLSTLSIDKDYVRAKVKQTLKKKLKQQHRRLCSKGEAALVTAQRRDQQDTIQLHLE